MLTKRDFAALAAVLLELRENEAEHTTGQENIPFEEIVWYLAGFCACQNPAFNIKRWVDAIRKKTGALWPISA